MSARERDRAVEAFLDPLQRAVSCVTRAVLVKGYTQPGTPQLVNLSNDPVRLQGPGRLGLSILLAYDTAPPEEPAQPSWRVAISGYAYELEDPAGRMVLAYHWHPSGQSPAVTPHLHLGGSVRSIDLSKAHLPTGIVTLQEILRFLIVDLGVSPLRPDWPEVLASAAPPAAP